MGTSATRELIAPADAPSARSREAASPAVPGRLAASFYLVGALFIITPVADGIANSLPIQASLATWRYGAVGAFANYLISPLFGALLLTATASLLGHRRTLRTLGVTWILAALLLLALAADFTLDVLQLRAMVPPEQAGVFKVGAGKALAKYLTSIATFILFASACFQRRRH